VLSSLGVDVLVDCGRLAPGSAAHDVVTEADLLVVVARPVVAEVHHLAARLSGLRPKALSLLLIGDRPYAVAEVADAVGANPLGTLPVDDRAAAALTVGRSDGTRVLRRSRLLRDARAVAEGLAGWLPPSPGRPPPAPPVARPPVDVPVDQPPRPGRRRGGRPDAVPAGANAPPPKHFRRERDEDRR
jgi:hypothetical protein